MAESTLIVSLVVENSCESRPLYRELLELFFRVNHVDASVDLLDALPASPAGDLVVVMGLVNSQILNRPALDTIQKKNYPVVLFGVWSDSPAGALAEAVSTIDLVSARDVAFMRTGNRYAPVVGDPLDSLSALQERTGDSSNEPDSLQRQMVFFSAILDLARQHRAFGEQLAHRANPQKLFELAEAARSDGDYHLARWLYRTAYQGSANDLVLFRQGEVENLLGMVENARKRMLKAVRSAPGEIQKALKQPYLYDPDAFKNKFVEDCPLCGGKPVPYSAVWCVYAATYDKRFDPIRTWLYCPDCNHGFAHNIPANLDDLFRDDYTFMTKYKPATDYGSVTHFSTVLERLSRHTEKRKVLDVGAGQGPFALAALQLQYDYTGLEVIPAYANNVQRLVGHRIYCTDIMAFESPEQFDIVICGDVIEHLEDIRSFVRKIKSFLAEGGLLWLSTPDMFAPYHKINPDMDAMPREVWHFNYFTAQSLEMLLEQEGIDIIDMTMSTRYLGSIELICKNRV